MTPAPAGSRIRQIASPKSSFLPFGSAAPPEANRFFPGTEPIGAEDKLIMLVLTKRSYTMRAAFPPVSFSVWRLSSATRSSKSVFLRHQGATRLAATCLLFTLAMMMVPKADISETLFDEANTPTNEIVVEKTATLCEPRQPVTAFVPKKIAQRQRVCVHRISPVYAKLLTDSRTFRALFCSLLC